MRNVSRLGNATSHGGKVKAAPAGRWGRLLIPLPLLTRRMNDYAYTDSASLPGPLYAESW
jgi:hypothetical protein